MPEGEFMDAQLICYCILILSGAFALLSLGLLFIRMSLAVKKRLF